MSSEISPITSPYDGRHTPLDANSSQDKFRDKFDIRGLFTDPILRPEENSHRSSDTIVFSNIFENPASSADPSKKFEDGWKSAIKKAKDTAIEEYDDPSSKNRVDVKALDKVGKLFENLGTQIAKGSLSKDDIKDFQAALKEMDMSRKTAKAAEFMAERLSKQTEEKFGVHVEINLDPKSGPKSLTFGTGGNPREQSSIKVTEDGVEAYRMINGFTGWSKSETGNDGKKITVDSIMTSLKPKKDTKD